MSQGATPSDVASAYLQHGPYGRGHERSLKIPKIANPFQFPKRRRQTP